jgi:hypothetical protein
MYPIVPAKVSNSGGRMEAEVVTESRATQTGTFVIVQHAIPAKYNPC